VAGKSGQRSGKSAGFNRLALVIFSALFVVLFVVFAVAEGIGDPSVPSGDVAVVKGVADGNVSETAFKRALVQQIAGAQLKKPPKPGSTKYEELRAQALGEMLDTIWISAEAEDLGISVTDKQIETELANVKKQNFPTKKAYAEFLKTSNFTQADVDSRVELQLLSQAIQQQITNETPPVSNAEITAFYDTSKATQFTAKASRDVRIIVNRNKAKAEAAKAALDKDDSAASWKKVAAKYSADPTTKAKGGLQKEISEELLQGPLKKAIYGSATGEVVGPVNYQGNYFVVEVEKLNAEKVKPLGEVKSQIASQLTEQKQQEFFTQFVSAYQSKWTARTFCGSEFTSASSATAASTLVQRCANFKSSGRPAGAPAACYEANPKTPATECPAPVEQIKPAIPGSVTALKPSGEQLVQRPRPETTKAAATERKAAEVVEKAAAGRGE
jgi:parvulin-like peptidyl-prolyl isomerase